MNQFPAHNLGSPRVAYAERHAIVLGAAMEPGMHLTTCVERAMEFGMTLVIISFQPF